MNNTCSECDKPSDSDLSLCADHALLYYHKVFVSRVGYSLETGLTILNHYLDRQEYNHAKRYLDYLAQEEHLIKAINQLKKILAAE